MKNEELAKEWKEREGETKNTFDWFFSMKSSHAFFYDWPVLTVANESGTDLICLHGPFQADMLTIIYPLGSGKWGQFVGIYFLNISEAKHTHTLIFTDAFLSSGKELWMAKKLRN